MNEEKYINVNIVKNTRYNLIEIYMEEIVQSILRDIAEHKNGECRFLYYGDENTFCNANPKEDDFKLQHLTCQTYSIPLDKCYYHVLYSLFDSLVSSTISNFKRGYTTNPIMLCKSIKVKGENLEIEFGVGLQEE